MTTQLRLVEPPEPRSRAAARATTAARATAAKGAARSVVRTRGAAGGARTGRRAASWGEWHLDARTRRVGRAGVARAREALEAVAEHELRAS